VNDIGTAKKVNASFAALSAQTITGALGSAQTAQPAYVTDLVASSISGPFMATSADALAGSSSSKLLTPSVLPAVLANPGVIGKTAASDAYFNTMTATSIAGQAMANSMNVWDSTITTKA
jgi:hypothetical protein